MTSQPSDSLPTCNRAPPEGELRAALSQCSDDTAPNQEPSEVIDYAIVDADGHVVEPDHVFFEILDERFRELFVFIRSVSIVHVCPIRRNNRAGKKSICLGNSLEFK